MKLDEKEAQLVIALCDKANVQGLQAMQDIMMLAGKCQRFLRPPAAPAAEQKVESLPKEEAVKS